LDNVASHSSWLVPAKTKGIIAISRGELKQRSASSLPSDSVGQFHAGRSIGEFLREASDFVPKADGIGLQEIDYCSDAKPTPHDTIILIYFSRRIGRRDMKISQTVLCVFNRIIAFFEKLEAAKVVAGSWSWLIRPEGRELFSAESEC
jgi:hypothetical protein